VISVVVCIARNANGITCVTYVIVASFVVDVVVVIAYGDNVAISHVVVYVVCAEVVGVVLGIVVVCGVVVYVVFIVASCVIVS